MKKTIKFKTSSPAGDLIAMLAGIQELCTKLDARAVIYQRLNMTGIGYQGAIHPFKNEIGDEVAMNDNMFELLRPLLKEQWYIEDFIVYDGQEFNYDLDKVRLQVFTNQPLGSINRWLFYVYPQMACDLSKKWLDLPSGKSNVTYDLIINFTYRYRNSVIDYHFLKKYENRILFVGLKEECEFFSKQWNLKIEFLEYLHFLSVAKLMASSKCFLGNQSVCFQVAEGLKVKRILELSPIIPNVIPTGENAYDFYHQDAVEYYVESLMN